MCFSQKLSSGEVLSILIPMSSTLLMEWEAASVHRDLVGALSFFLQRKSSQKMNLNQKGREGSVRRLLILPIKTNAKVLQRPERASNSAHTELHDRVSFSAFCIPGVGWPLVNPFTVGVRMQQI